MTVTAQFGGISGRRKGGIRSQYLRHSFPSYYRNLGCNVANEFCEPSTSDARLAEFIGIVLGDGGLTSNQLRITLNRVADKEYVGYVTNLIVDLFEYKPSQKERKDSSATVLNVNGVQFVNLLRQYGLYTGNKVKLQVGVPAWIQSDISLSTSCAKGLMDTDGCLFINRYKSNNKYYSYKKLAFSNRSVPILKFFYETMQKLSFHPIYYQNKQIRLCREEEVNRYLQIVGSSNPRIFSVKI